MELYIDDEVSAKVTKRAMSSVPTTCEYLRLGWAIHQDCTRCLGWG